MTGGGRFDGVSEARMGLHWLPIRQRILYKVLTEIYKSVVDFTPIYLREMFELYVNTGDLRSSSDVHRLMIKRTKRKASPLQFPL